MPRRTKSAAAQYHVAVVDQNVNEVRVFDRNAKAWDDDAIIWSFKGVDHWPGHGWADLSDAKIRKTRDRDLIALVAASGGGVGIVDIKKEGEKANSDDDLIWSAYPNGNPHAIERIPDNGSILAASSEGTLHLYSPEDPDDIDDFRRYDKNNSWDFPGAHGILWDPRTKSTQEDGVLWVLGDGKLVGYKVKGKGMDTDLDRWRTVEIRHHGHKMGHDLQPDYANKGRLLLTDSEGVYGYDVNADKLVIGEDEELWGKNRVKSIARHPSGEFVWVVGSKDTGEMGTHVSFGTELGAATDEIGWKDARFYKARIFSPEYE
jgi:hypothetical protein